MTPHAAVTQLEHAERAVRLAAPLRRRTGVEQSNSSVFFEDYGMLKTYRRLQPGPHPEIEMSRFLVERAGFANTPPPLATLDIAITGPEGTEECALGVLFGFVRNQGDGWTLALNYLTRYLDDALIDALAAYFKEKHNRDIVERLTKQVRILEAAGTCAPWHCRR